MCCNPSNGRVEFEGGWFITPGFITMDEMKACQLTRTKYIKKIGNIFRENFVKARMGNISKWSSVLLMFANKMNDNYTKREIDERKKVRKESTRNKQKEPILSWKQTRSDLFLSKTAVEMSSQNWRYIIFGIKNKKVILKTKRKKQVKYTKLGLLEKKKENTKLLKVFNISESLLMWSHCDRDKVVSLKQWLQKTIS
jgi:hypothetical protein